MALQNASLAKHRGADDMRERVYAPPLCMRRAGASPAQRQPCVHRSKTHWKSEVVAHFWKPTTKKWGKRNWPGPGSCRADQQVGTKGRRVITAAATLAEAMSTGLADISG